MYSNVESYLGAFVKNQRENAVDYPSWKLTYARKNKLLLISINFTPKTSHSCLNKSYFPMFSMLKMMILLFQRWDMWSFPGICDRFLFQISWNKGPATGLLSCGALKHHLQLPSNNGNPDVLEMFMGGENHASTKVISSQFGTSIFLWTS